MLSIAGILVSLALLMWFAYRGVSVLILAPLAALLAVLAGVQEQARPQFGQPLLGAQIVVDEQTAATGAGGQFTAQEEVLPVQAEHGLDHGPIPSGTDHVGRDALAENEIQGAQDEGFARAGLAGQGVEARTELQFHIVDEGQIANAQGFEHVRRVLYGACVAIISPRRMRIRSDGPRGRRRTPDGRSATQAL